MKPKISQPVIGIVICGLDGRNQFVANPYIQSIRYSDGIPILLPLVRSDSMLQNYVEVCDGFLFCGGGDITPLLFGQEPRDRIGKTDITLDLFQIRFMKKILSSSKPVLAICRGMQILNAACGGTICQDIRYQAGRPFNHMQTSASRSDVSHPILVERNSRLSLYLGRRIFVNSFHHQTLDVLGSHLSAAAHASDRTIEAVEHTSHPFAIGVQWHPECMYRTSPQMRSLFKGFIRSCRKNLQDPATTPLSSPLQT